MVSPAFAGNVFIFHCFDIGDDINFEMIRRQQILARRQPNFSRHFKNYHIPITVELPHPHHSAQCEQITLHSFGVVSLRYRIPFFSTLDALRTKINDIDSQYEERSISDAQALFKRIKSAVNEAKFYQMHKSYVLVQVEPQLPLFDAHTFKEQFGSTVASILRFETETLSEFTRDEILESAHGYYRGDLIIIDNDAAFAYDDDYEELLDLFEFANVQDLELQFFDRLLDERLTQAYGTDPRKKLPMQAFYLPFWGVLVNDPVSELNRLRVDISVVTERLESSIKVSGEPYYVELYQTLSKKLALESWRESIAKKLELVSNITSFYQEKIDVVRQDFFTVIIIILIFLELMLGVFRHAGV